MRAGQQFPKVYQGAAVILITPTPPLAEEVFLRREISRTLFNNKLEFTLKETSYALSAIGFGGGFAHLAAQVSAPLKFKTFFVVTTERVAGIPAIVYPDVIRYGRRWLVTINLSSEYELISHGVIQAGHPLLSRGKPGVVRFLPASRLREEKSRIVREIKNAGYPF